MILTNDFVVINYPKTGSTYMRECIKRIYEEPSLKNRLLRKKKVFKELLLPKLYGVKGSRYKDQHGVVRQIPKAYKAFPIVTVIRNPLNRTVSSYHYEWWKRHPIYEVSKIEELFPTFPEIGLMDFMKMHNHPDLTPDNLLKEYTNDLGYLTRLFLVFYSNDPIASAKKLVSTKCSILDVIVPNIHFLKQEQLEQDLTTYIENHTDKDASLIADVAEQNTGDYKAPSEYPSDFKNYMIDMERPLFEAFYPEVLD